MVDKPSVQAVPTKMSLANGTAVASWSSRPCNNGRCVLTYIHPNVSTDGPPTSSAVPANHKAASARPCQRVCETQARQYRSAMEAGSETRLHPVMSGAGVTESAASSKRIVGKLRRLVGVWRGCWQQIGRASCRERVEI